MHNLTEPKMAPASTAESVRIVDLLAANEGRARRVLDVVRAFLNVSEGEEV